MKAREEKEVNCTGSELHEVGQEREEGKERIKDQNKKTRTAGGNSKKIFLFDFHVLLSRKASSTSSGFDSFASKSELHLCF